MAVSAVLWCVAINLLVRVVMDHLGPPLTAPQAVVMAAGMAAYTLGYLALRR